MARIQSSFALSGLTTTINNLAKVPGVRCRRRSFLWMRRRKPRSSSEVDKPSLKLPAAAGAVVIPVILPFAFAQNFPHARRMEPAALVAVIVILISAGASFFFSLAETALFSLGKWQARQLAERDPVAGGRVLQLLTEAQDLLATMVLGNTFAIAAMLATGFWMALRGGWFAIPTVIGLFILILFIGEVLPKTLAVRRPEFWSLREIGRAHV